MEKETHSSTRVMKIAGCLLVAAFAQTTLPKVNLRLGHIDWLLLVTVYVGLMRDPGQALLTGTAAGLLQDASSVGPIGVSGLAKVLSAYLAYWISSRVYVEGMLVRVATLAGASAVNSLTIYSFYRMLGFDLPAFYRANGMVAIVGLDLLANLLISLPLFLALDRLFQTGARLRARRAEAMRGMRRRRWKKMI